MRKTFQRIIDYIEENVRAEITAEELAEMAGYSLYHFYRLFQAATGHPVMQYVLKRRLVHAVYEMLDGGKRNDIILAYGFNTYAGFYRAFRRNFCCTPSEYISMNRVKRPVKPDLFKEEDMHISHNKTASMLKYWGKENEKVLDIFYENTGNHNDHAYNIGNEWTLKFTKNLGNVLAHAALARALEGAGIAFAGIVPTTTGENYVQSGDVYYYLVRRIPGKQINAMDVYEGNTAFSIGVMLGKLHKALESAEAIASDANFFDTVLYWAAKNESVEKHMGKELLAELTKELSACKDHMPMQLIHRDPNPGNIIVSKDGFGFIDFELSQRNIRIFDPVYAATAVLSETFSTEKRAGWFTVYRKIMQGYDSVAKLTEAEKNALPYVVIGNQLICLAFFASDEKYKDIFATNLAMTGWIAENREKLKIF